MGDPKDKMAVNSNLARVFQLGAASEKLFSHLRQVLRRRTTAQPTQPPNDQRADDARDSGTLRSIDAARRSAEQSTRLNQMLHQHESEVEHLNGILAALDEGIIMQNTEGRITLINRAAQELLGDHKNFWESELGHLFNAYRDVISVDSELMPLGEPTRVQVNNRILGAQLAAVADSHGQRLGTMIVLRDVTQETLSERLKDQFVTAISHELRTPMTVIKGASEVLASLPKDQPANRRLLDTLSRNVDTLDRMVVELLDLSEMGAGTFNIRQEAVNLEDLLWSVVKSMASELEKARLDVALMMRDVAQLVVQGDDQRLRWAFGHLLQNSIRYTEPNGHIVIAAGVDEENPNFLAIDVIDTGVGIADKDKPHIFERFYRGEPRTSTGKLLDPRGLGQGLFIAKTVANAHGGYITVRSLQGEGSFFTMVLPASPQ